MPETVNEVFCEKLKTAVPSFLQKLESDFRSDRQTVDLLQDKKEQNKKQLEDELRLLNAESTRILDEVNKLQKENGETISRIDILKKEGDNVRTQIQDISKREDLAIKENAVLKKKEATSAAIKKDKAAELEKVMANSRKGGCC